MEIKQGRIYSAKNPRIITLPAEGRFWNDRQVIYCDGITVQYDSPAVKPGQNYPKMPIEKFEKWAKEDVTDITPENAWRKVEK
ncbi:hypothetical protein [Neisseria weixii]|nr:hypothetical protein [Neisseria weixii]